MPRNRVLLPEHLIRRCFKWGDDLVEHYARTGRQTPNGVELDPIKQALAKMGECAFCIWVPMCIEAVGWKILPFGDNGFDVIVSRIGRIDVKWSRHLNGRLIWPWCHNHKFAGKPFDRLVLVTGDHDAGFDVRGWVTKQRFAREHETGGHGLDQRTWNMGDDVIDDMKDFFSVVKMQRASGL